MSVDRILHGPGDWLGDRFSARQRRSLYAWLLILSVLVTPLLYVWKDAVWMVWALSIVAVWLTLATLVGSETPVEQERS